MSILSRIKKYFKMLTLRKPKERKIENTIITIQAYKLYFGKKKTQYSWVFDDEAVGLKKEAFVAGADQVCEFMCEAAGKTEDVVIQFSASFFPTEKLVAYYVEGSIETGTTYYAPALKQTLWLCPALGRYFTSSPKEIHVNFF